MNKIFVIMRVDSWENVTFLTIKSIGTGIHFVWTEEPSKAYEFSKLKDAKQVIGAINYFEHDDIDIALRTVETKTEYTHKRVK